ncbi:MAG: tetratricopeptide repeat protein [Candidatus Peregrinibacteria bacterium]
MEKADAGEPVNQYFLALNYYQGDEVRVDKRRAFDLVKQSAEQGIPEAALLLGAMYAMGDGIPTNKEQAEKWLLKAAELGVPEAQLNLSHLYHELEAGKPYGKMDFKSTYVWLEVAKAFGVETEAFVLVLPERQAEWERAAAETFERVKRNRAEYCKSHVAWCEWTQKTFGY